jgi:hypothetical protein
MQVPSPILKYLAFEPYNMWQLLGPELDIVELPLYDTVPFLKEDVGHR